MLMVLHVFFNSWWCLLCLKCPSTSNLSAFYGPSPSEALTFCEIFWNLAPSSVSYVVSSHCIPVILAHRMGVALYCISRASLEAGTKKAQCLNERKKAQIRKVAFILHSFWKTESIPAVFWRLWALRGWHLTTKKSSPYFSPLAVIILKYQDMV